MIKAFIKFLFIWVGCAFQAQMIPFVENYQLENLEVTGQIWDITESENHLIFAANGNGLLVFNGLNWQLQQLPNKTTIRSILAVGNKVYTGSYQEFGFWEMNTYGEMVYHSITDENPQIEFNNEEFWQIISFQDAIYFRSFYRVYRLKKGKLQAIPIPSTVISLSVVNNQLLVATLNNGLHKVEGVKLNRLNMDQSNLFGKKIIKVDHYKGKYFLFTELDGCYILQNNAWQEWNIPISSKLRKYQLNKFERLPDGRMIFGTIQNGEYITKSNGDIITHLDRKNGLDNSTILSHFYDSKKHLWLGLDQGLARVDLSNSNLFYNDSNGILGSVYGVLLYNNTTFLGSNTGLYYIDPNFNLQFVEGTQGHVWQLQNIEGDLICGHNNGTYKIQNKTPKLISNHAGGWVIKQSPELSNVYIQGTYSGLVRFEKMGNNWQVDFIEGVDFPIRYLEFESNQVAWFAHSNQGLYKIKFSSDYKKILEVKRYKSTQWSDYKLRINKLHNDILVKSNTGWLRYDPIIDSLHLDSTLNKMLGMNSYLASGKDMPLAVLKNPNNLDFRSKTKLSESIFKTGEYYKSRVLIENSIVTPFNDSLFAYNLKDGFMLIQKSNMMRSKTKLQTPTLFQLEFNNNALELNDENKYDIPFKHDEIKLVIATPSESNYFLEYSLNVESGDWKALKSSILRFNHLQEGSQKLAIRTANDLNQFSDPLMINIDISPPWYKSWVAFIFYLFFLALIIMAVYYAHKRKVEREQEALKNEMQKQQDKKIIAVKNENLQKEVNRKSKELANNAMALIRKDEVLLHIKELLNSRENQLTNDILLNRINSKIDKSLGQEKEEWEIFENNFSKVHEDFFDQLKIKHPKLKRRDLQLCAYVKMNFSSKEISPLMSLSIRGVETQKYRLKKKMDLDKDINLYEYLLNF